MESMLTISCNQKDRRRAEKRNQLQTKFDSDMAGAERKVEEILATATDEWYV
jgi:hypothetical protein